MSQGEMLPQPVGRIDRRCDACACPMVKAHKVYRGKAVCANCYARLFKVRDCSKCGQSMRAYVRDENPVCDACVRATRKCLRCDKPTPRAGLMVNGKAVCNACAPYFRKPRACSRCGQNSTRLSRITGISEEPVCEKCQRELTQATCRECGKHRRVHSKNIDGRAICKSCAEQPGVSHSCPKCGGITPGAGNAMCRSCAMQESLLRKANALSMQYRNAVVKQIWLAFAQWLIVTNRVSPVLGRLRCYADVLAKVDGGAGDASEIVDGHLGATLSAEDLRRAGVLAEYLGTIGVLRSNHAARAEWSDEKRIAAALEEIRCHPWADDITHYNEHLSAAERKLNIRTRRVYIRAAIALMEYSAVSKTSSITSEMVAGFVRKHPGHRASLSAWLRFLKDQEGRLLKLPKGRVSKSKGMKACVDQVAILLTGVQEGRTPRQQMACLVKLLSVLYDVPLEVVLKLNRQDILERDGSIVLRFGEDWVEIDSRLETWLRWLLIENAECDQGYVFPGRRTGDAWSVSGVSYYFRGPSSA